MCISDAALYKIATYLNLSYVLLVMWLANVPSQSEIEARLSRLKQGKLVIAVISLSSASVLPFVDLFYWFKFSFLLDF